MPEPISLRLPNARPGAGTEPASEARAAGPLLLTPRQAAEALAISERTLWGLTARGEVRSVKIGRAVRYAQADLVAYVEHLRGQGK